MASTPHIKQWTTIPTALMAWIWVLGLLFGGDEEAVLATRMYSNQLARQKGDILTILISESMSSSKSDSHKTSKEESASASAPTLGNQDGRRLSKFLDRFEVPGYGVSANSSFKGSGEAATEESLSATMTVRVADVLDNGLLLIRGEREVVHNREHAKLVITGLVRPRDISKENTIASSMISDLKVVYQSKGSISRASRPGWFWRLLQFLNPF
ncbi:MAG: flagellar basal body L-ring protein FlgH [Lentisphaerae bacterium]|nr:MAG: flagellar basal body L-ring protein FlgH [Lentisphaerota bacterium]